MLPLLKRKIQNSSAAGKLPDSAINESLNTRIRCFGTISSLVRMKAEGPAEGDCLPPPLFLKIKAPNLSNARESTPRPYGSGATRVGAQGDSAPPLAKELKKLNPKMQAFKRDSDLTY